VNGETRALSPCTGICTLDAGGRICISCGRSIEQIACWSALTDAQRRAVMSALAARVPTSQ